MTKKGKILAAGVGLLMAAGSLWAEVEVPQIQTPTVYGSTGAIRTISAKTLGGGKMSFAISVDAENSTDAFGTGAITFIRADGTVEKTIGLDSYYAATYRAMLSFGLSEWFDLGVNVPLHHDNITVKDYPRASKPEIQRGVDVALGDIEVWGKLQYPPYDHSPIFDIAFLGMVTIPAGSTGKGLAPKALYYLPKPDVDREYNAYTTDKVTARGMMLITLDLLEVPGTYIPIEIDVNGGLQTSGSSDFDNAFLLGGALVLKPIPWFSIFGDVTAVSRMSGIHSGWNIREDKVIVSPGATIKSPVGVFITGSYDISLAKSHGNDIVYDADGDGNKIAYNYSPESKGFGAVVGWTNYIVSPDKDADGILNKYDKCPLEPEDFDNFEDEDGCPDLDNDKDGVYDADDKCPEVPGHPDNHGCPLPDRDGDSVPDVEDDCPDSFGPPKNHGCPDTVRVVDTLTVTDTLTKVDTLDNTPASNAACPFIPVNFINNYSGPVDSTRCPLPDRDKDGVCDSWVSEMSLLDHYVGVCKGNDACPSDAEDMDGFEDADGCPDPDNDGDGFCDAWVSENGLLGKYSTVCHGVDKCADQPETMNGFEDADGCPDKLPKKPIELKGVEFHAGKSELTDAAMDALMPTVNSLKENDDAIIEIGGHTDNTGKAKANQRISEARAQAVADFLREQGVKCEIRVKGYGSSQPKASNKTAAGKRQNRRIEMKILGSKAAASGDAKQ